MTENLIGDTYNEPTRSKMIVHVSLLFGLTKAKVMNEMLCALELCITQPVLLAFQCNQHKNCESCSLTVMTVVKYSHEQI